MPFFTNMDIAYKKASLVICRAGATTLTELSSYKLPCIIIPYPFAKDDHQTANAKEFCRKNYRGRLLVESKMNIDLLKKNINDLERYKDSSIKEINNNFSVCCSRFIKPLLENSTDGTLKKSK